MEEQQTNVKTYTQDQILKIFEKPLGHSLLSWSLPQAFKAAASNASINYLEKQYCIAAGNVGEPAVYFEVENVGNSSEIYIGFGRSVDPKSFSGREFNHYVGGKSQDGKVAIETIGTDFDRLEIYIRKLWPEEKYAVHLADPFRSTVYPNQTTEDQESLVSFAGAIMRLIRSGVVVDLAAIKTEICMLDIEKDHSATLVSSYYMSPKVKQLIDEDRARQGKKPFHDAMMAGDIKDIRELKIPKPVYA